eukprot:Sdes_comp17959_c0_seq2m7214
MSVYIRVKRKKTTIFLEATSEEKVISLKKKLEPLTKMSPENIKLFSKEKPLEDEKNLAFYNIDNDDVVAMVFKDGGDWEAIDIAPLSQPPALDLKAEDGKEKQG